jgi:hypothetical protein
MIPPLEVVALPAPLKVLAAPMLLEVPWRRCTDVAAGVGRAAVTTGDFRGAGAARSSRGTAAQGSPEALALPLPLEVAALP